MREAPYRSVSLTSVRVSSGEIAETQDVLPQAAVDRLLQHRARSSPGPGPAVHGQLQRFPFLSQYTFAFNRGAGDPGRPHPAPPKEREWQPRSCWSTEACSAPGAGSATIAELAALGTEAAAFDLPGHGDDGTPRDSVTVADYVAAVVDRLDAAPEPVVLAGHSMAGYPIAAAALQRPGQGPAPGLLQRPGPQTRPVLGGHPGPRHPRDLRAGSRGARGRQLRGARRGGCLALALLAGPGGSRRSRRSAPASPRSPPGRSSNRGPCPPAPWTASP